jgi:carbamoyltransferase
MSFVVRVRPEKRALIPAVVHVDATARLQTVRREDNPLFWQLLMDFGAATGVPVLLNTSFNENEPIVCSPDEAIACFLRTPLDALFLEGLLVVKEAAIAASAG